jgi:hypothetical protein
VKERHAGGASGESSGVVSNVCRCVPMATAREQARSEVDGRKFRGSPLRDCIGAISFGATVVGKIHTAGLKGELLAAIQPELRKEWLETLDQAVRALSTGAPGSSRR